MSGPEPATVDAYIDGFPDEVATRLRLVRQAIVQEVPEPEEKMRYGLAAVMLGGRYALHFGGWKKHIGLYPVIELPDDLEAEIAPYRSGKNSVVFPHSAEIPYDLISRLTAVTVATRGSAS